MNIRQTMEQREEAVLSKKATLSRLSKGRARAEEPCDIRPCFQRDRDRILHSKAFRRLKDKTQVFLTPIDDHYRNRLTHTLEVSQNARTIAKALMLNEELTEAIALGHDLGHTPFGHAGERILNDLCRPYNLGFAHNEQSLRVVEHLERDGLGLNLTYEVKDGIRNHRSSERPQTAEGRIVRYSDKIAYMYHDCDDAIRGKILKESDIPKSICGCVGNTNKERLNAFIHDLVDNSASTGVIQLSPPVEDAFNDLKDFLFKNVYTNSEAKAEERKAENLIKCLFEYLRNNIDNVPDVYLDKAKELNEPVERAVCDYIASMTDHFAINYFVPKAWR